MWNKQNTEKAFGVRAKQKTLCASVCGHAFIIDCVKLESFGMSIEPSIMNDIDNNYNDVDGDGKCLGAKWITARNAIVTERLQYTFCKEL